MTEFKDYDKKKIAAKLQQIKVFEAQYGENDTSRGWKKWCTDYEYRKREWTWRQGIAKYAENPLNMVK